MTTIEDVLTRTAMVARTHSVSLKDNVSTWSRNNLYFISLQSDLQEPKAFRSGRISPGAAAVCTSSYFLSRLINDCDITSFRFRFVISNERLRSKCFCKEMEVITP